MFPFRLLFILAIDPMYPYQSRHFHNYSRRAHPFEVYGMKISMIEVMRIAIPFDAHRRPPAEQETTFNAASPS